MESLLKNDKDDMSDGESSSRTCSSPSSFYKMSVDSDDASSVSSKSLHKRDEVLFFDAISRPTSNSNNNKKSTRSYDFRERPERRSVNRKSSLLPKSKALLRVIDQADEDTHLADVEMRREHDTTSQLNKLDPQSKSFGDVPAASWTKVPDAVLYQCSKLNPEIEMTNFQFEHISHHKSIKRKASEDRFEPYPTSSFGMKRRAVSPSVSLGGSPVLTGISSPPSSSFSLFTSSNAAAASNRPKPGSFNLQEASGSLSRMSISE